MRIALLNPVRFYGGSEKRVVQAALEFRRRGHSPAVLAHPRGEAFQRLQALELPVSPFALGRRLSPGRILSTARAFAHHSTEVAICYTERALQHAALAADLVPFLSGGKQKRPAVVYYYSGTGVFRKSRFNRSFIAPRVARFVANARATYDELQAFGWFREKQLACLYDGVDPAPIDSASGAGVREELGCGPDDLAVMVSARLVALKGHDLLIDAVAELSEAYPHVHLWFAGDGPEKDRLTAKIDRAGLSRRVRLLGFRSDIPRLLHAADVLCHPSRKEGAPNAVLEAMVAGLPVVATAAYGTAELIMHGETGLLSPVDDRAALKANLATVLADADLRRRLGEAGRERALTEFSEKKSTDLWLELLAECI